MDHDSVVQLYVTSNLLFPSCLSFKKVCFYLVSHFEFVPSAEQESLFVTSSCYQWPFLHLLSQSLRYLVLSSIPYCQLTHPIRYLSSCLGPPL